MQHERSSEADPRITERLTEVSHRFFAPIVQRLQQTSQPATAPAAVPACAPVPASAAGSSSKKLGDLPQELTRLEDRTAHIERMLRDLFDTSRATEKRSIF